MAKLCVKAFGFTCGIISAGLSLAAGALNMFFYLENGLGKAMEIVYSGYQPTFSGVVLSSVVCFIFAVLLGSAFAWLYNRFIDESAQETQEKIKAVARSIWESKGKPENSSAEDWREAEKIVRGI